MFTPLGKFSNVPCPKANQCDLLNCFFSHNSETLGNVESGLAAQTNKINEPPNKRRKIVGLGNTELSHNLIGTVDYSQSNAKRNASSDNINPPRETRNYEAILKSTSISETNPKIISTPPAQQKPLASKRSGTSNASGSQVPAQESLNPRRVARDPVGHQKRVLYLKKLHEEMTRLNKEVAGSSDPNVRALHLTDGEMIKLALDEEENIVRNSLETYANVIKLRMVAYKKMTVDQWKTRQLQVLESQKPSEKPAENPNKSTEGRLKTSLDDLNEGLSEQEQLKILQHVLASLEGLEAFGYVTQKPTENEVAAAKAGVEASRGWENCARCKSRFQVYPSRQEDGSLTSPGKCIYHYGRAQLPPKSKSERIQGVSQKTYTCCNEPVGSSVGCTEAETHVFKVENPKRLAATMQFIETPENAAEDVAGAVCFDCEMGYTVFGMELIRITAVDWPKGKQLLDVLVRPLGTTLDLNTRFSGVTLDQFASARSYSPESNGAKDQTQKPGLFEDSNFNRPKDTIMIVDSPEEARKLLFKLITPTTPLIGHAIDNDLNAVRIIHPCIVDTVLLFPHPGGLPRRRALKSLTKELLGRDIQTGGASGHDSLEDAQATGDLVRLKVAQKWKEMKHGGWSFKDGELVGPS